MGLVTFSMMVVTVSLLFISDREYARIRDFLCRVEDLLRGRVKYSFLLSTHPGGSQDADCGSRD